MHKLFFLKIFIYLAVLGLTCSMWHLWSLLHHLRSFVVACGTQFPDQEWNLGPLHWEHRVLATGSPEKSLFKKKKSIYLFIPCNIICKSERLEKTQVSINWGPISYIIDDTDSGIICL